MIGQQYGAGRRLLEGLGQLSAGRGAEGGRVRRTGAQLEGGDAAGAGLPAQVRPPQQCLASGGEQLSQRTGVGEYRGALHLWVDHHVPPREWRRRFHDARAARRGRARRDEPRRRSPAPQDGRVPQHLVRKAAAGDPAPLHPDHLLAVQDRLEVMGDDERRPPSRQPVEGATPRPRCRSPARSSPHPG